MPYAAAYIIEAAFERGLSIWVRAGGCNRVCPGIQKVRVQPATMGLSAVATRKHIIINFNKVVRRWYYFSIWKGTILLARFLMVEIILQYAIHTRWVHLSSLKCWFPLTHCLRADKLGVKYLRGKSITTRAVIHCFSTLECSDAILQDLWVLIPESFTLYRPKWGVGYIFLL